MTEISLKMFESHVGFFLYADSWAIQNAVRVVEALKDDWPSKHQVKHLCGERLETKKTGLL